MKKPSQVKNYVRYVATRPNAEKFEVNQSQREATEHQKRWIEKELKAHKELRESCEQEYEDYLENPTRENAMELPKKVWQGKTAWKTMLATLPKDQEQNEGNRDTHCGMDRIKKSI